jgi:hypothetical protein
MVYDKYFSTVIILGYYILCTILCRLSLFLLHMRHFFSFAHLTEG